MAALDAVCLIDGTILLIVDRADWANQGRRFFYTSSNYIQQPKVIPNPFLTPPRTDRHIGQGVVVGRTRPEETIVQ